MNIWQKFRAFSRARQITTIVFTLHFVTIFSMSINHYFASSFKQKKKSIAVHTIKKQPIAKAERLPPKQNQKTSPQPKAIASHAPLKTKKEIPPQKKVPAKHAENKQKEETNSLLKELKENLETISTGPTSTRKSSLILPTVNLTQKKEVSKGDESKIKSYEEVLIAFLQTSLDLPEFGEVKARFDIDADGKLSSLEILESHNQKNAEFLNEKLSELIFPSISEASPAHQLISFTITFKNRTN